MLVNNVNRLEEQHREVEGFVKLTLKYLNDARTVKTRTYEPNILNSACLGSYAMRYIP